MRIARRTSAVCVVAALMAAAAASAATASVPKLVSSAGPARAGRNPQVKPHTIIYTGDGSGLLAGTGKASRRPNFGRLDWTSWSATGAHATGANWIDNCLPNCASGRFTAFPVEIQAFRPRVVAGYKIFTRMKVSYTARLPSFVHHRTRIWRIRHTRHQYFWVFPS
jgi:hypothetical protein